MRARSALPAAMAAACALSLLAGCASAPTEEAARDASVQDPPRQQAPAAVEAQGASVEEVPYTTPSGQTGYLYTPSSVTESPSGKAPLVLMMCSTGGEARSDARACGWVDKAAEEGIIVLVPGYDNYATYSQTEGIVSAVEHALSAYPVDGTRVYATGFSNGGATAVALASTHPQLFAAVSAYGWMVDMRGQDASYDMPFQVIQGTREYTQETASGAPSVMDDEQQAIRSLLLFNEMIEPSVQPDYDAVPYWGYAPDETRIETPDGREWTFSDYGKIGYSAPFAQLVLIEGAEHRPNEHEASASWSFFERFSRAEDGSVAETAER